MKRIISLLAAIFLIAALAGCSLIPEKEIPLEGFGLGDYARSQVEIQGEGDQPVTVPLLQVEIDYPVTIALPLPEVKDLALSATSSDNVRCDVGEGSIVVTGLAYCRREPVTITLSAPKYVAVSYTFAVNVSLHDMTLEILPPNAAGEGGVNPDAGGPLSLEPLKLVEGESVTLPLLAMEGADISVVSVLDDTVLEAVVEDGSLVVRGLGPGSAQLVLEAAASKYYPAQAELNVEVSAKPAPPPPAAAAPNVYAQQPNQWVDNTAYLDFIEDIIYYTNQVRLGLGLSAVTHLAAVDVPAALRAREADIYWSHTRPNGEEWYTIFAECGLSYPNKGENLFSDRTRPTAQEVVQAWVDSPKHYEVMIQPAFRRIGVGVYRGREYWVFCQIFV